PEMRDHALAMMLALARNLPAFLEQQRHRVWKRVPVGGLGGRTVGIIGLGEVGRAVAAACKALGMRVLGVRFDPRRPDGADDCADEVFGPDEWRRALAASDFVVVLLPLTQRTRGLFDERALAAMRAGAVLVHMSRGGIVDEGALCAALCSGALAG